MTFDLLLGAWQIQDGLLSDFEQGTTRKFAVEGFPQDRPVHSPPDPSRSVGLRSLGEGIYELDAIVMEVAHGWHTLDVGFVLCCQGMPEGWHPGDRIKGCYAIGVEFEAAAIAENLRHEWLIEDILIQTAPFVIEVDEYGREVHVRDPALLARKSIKRTNAWDDDGGNGAYLLRCRLLPDD